MIVAGEKTQLLVLSQNARDAVGCTIKVAGKTVAASDTPVLLGSRSIAGSSSAPTAVVSEDEYAPATHICDA